MDLWEIGTPYIISFFNAFIWIILSAVEEFDHQPNMKRKIFWNINHRRIGFLDGLYQLKHIDSLSAQSRDSYLEAVGAGFVEEVGLIAKYDLVTFPFLSLASDREIGEFWTAVIARFLGYNRTLEYQAARKIYQSRPSIILEEFR